jgi:hypothetical protein
MRRRWFCVGAKPGAADARVYSVHAGGYVPSGILAPLLPAPSPETPWRLGTRSSSTNAALVGNLWSQTPHACALSSLHWRVASLDKDEPVTWMQHEDLCHDPSVRWATGSRRSG